MKYLISLVVILSVSTNTVASDVFKLANEMLKTRDYIGVISNITESLESLDGEDKVQAYLLMGIAAHNNAVLYSRLQIEAIDSQLQYYGKLSSRRNRVQRSAYSYLYLGQVYLAKKFYGKAMRNLTRFSRKKNVDQRQKMLGTIDKAVVLYRLKRRSEAKRLLASVKSKDIEILSHKLVAQLKMGKKPRDIKEQLEKLKKHPNLSARSISNILFSYNYINEPGAGELVRNVVLSRPVYIDSKKGKVVNFYDPTLIENLSKYYYLTSLRNLLKVVQHEKHGAVASFYLGKSYLEMKSYANVDKMAKHVKKSQAPVSFKATADIWQEIAKSKGEKSANKMISGVANKYPTNNKVLADALLACIHVGATCKLIVNQAQERVKQGSGLKFSRLNFALGKYYIDKKQLDIALRFLEAARDKSKKNRIDANDPLLLVNLAQIYRRTRVFSENLEIYFEMSKYHPAVRQIQDAVQGIYSMEQRSAGDVKIL